VRAAAASLPYLPLRPSPRVRAARRGMIARLRTIALLPKLLALLLLLLCFGF